MKITFIGCGNMAGAIINGLLVSGKAAACDITASAPSETTRERAEETWGIYTTADNVSAAGDGDIVVLAVKPQMLNAVADEIKGALTKEQLIISIVAGRSLTYLADLFGDDKRIIRVMPNTPAKVGEGMSVWTAGDHVTDDDKAAAAMILAAIGKAVEVPERIFDAAGVVSGCSPAYVYMFIEALADAGVAEGVPRQMAYELAAQTVLGSARMVLESTCHPGELKDQVTSPGGSTIEGVQALEDGAFRGTVMTAIRAACDKTRRM